MLEALLGAELEWAQAWVLWLLPVGLLLPWLAREPRLAWSALSLSEVRPSLRQRLAFVPTLLTSLALAALLRHSDVASALFSPPLMASA